MFQIYGPRSAINKDKKSNRAELKKDVFDIPICLCIIYTQERHSKYFHIKKYSTNITCKMCRINVSFVLNSFDCFLRIENVKTEYLRVYVFYFLFNWKCYQQTCIITESCSIWIPGKECLYQCTVTFLK